MITKEQFMAGCEIWRVLDGKILFSVYNNNINSESASKTVLDNEDFFTTREEAEYAVIERFLVELNDW